MLAGPACSRYASGVDEVVTTLLLNFIALLFVSMMLDGPMKDPLAMGQPQSAALDPQLELSRLMARSRVHSGLLLACVLALAIWIVGASPLRLRPACRRCECPMRRPSPDLPVAHADPRRAAIRGAGGARGRWRRIAGRTSYLTLDMSPGYGYSGIVIAMLAGLNPLGVILAAIFVASVLVGADSMSRAVGYPTIWPM